ncbi:fibronectin type III domain-containing protein [Streptomyces olivoreticuli]
MLHKNGARRAALICATVALGLAIPATAAHAAPTASATAAPTTQDLTPPKPVSGLRASETEDGIWINWDLDYANPWDRFPIVDKNIKSFKLYRADDNGEPFKHIATVPGESAEHGFIDAEIKRNRYAVYHVTTVDIAGNESEASDTATGTPMMRITRETPDTPQGLKAKNVSGAVELSWTTDPYGTIPSKYLVYRYDKGRLNPTLVFETDATTYSDSRDLKPGASYTYRVVGVNSKGEEGDRSAPVQVTVPQS